MLLLLTLAACTAGTAAQQKEPSPVVNKTLLTDFSNDLAKQGDADHATVALRFVGIRDLPNGKTGDVVVELQRRNGKWADSGHTAAADYNQRSNNAVELGDLTYTDGKLAGTLQVTITADKPRPGGPAYLGPLPFPDPKDGPDVFSLTVDAQLRPEPVPFVEDTEKHEPPWRKDTPMFGGQHVAGTFSAKRGDHETRGTIVGGIAPAGMTDMFTTRGNIHLKPAPGGGVAVLARLSPTRVMSYTSVEASKRFAQPQDWSDYDAILLTIDSKNRRDEVGVRLSVAFDHGSQAMNAAGLLLGREHTFVIDLRHFSQGLGRVRGIGFGVENGFGVGDVEFTIRRIELAKLANAQPRSSADGPITLQLYPDTLRVHNGITEVPKGLFGMHSVNWPKEADEASLAYIRGINPGYMRPLDHTGFGGKPMPAEQIAAQREQRLKRDEPTDKVYQVMKAADAVDNVVWCHTQDLFSRPAWMDEGVEKWENQLRSFYHNQAANAWVPGDTYNVLRRFEVWNEPFFWGRHINMNHRLPPGKKDWTDDTQYGYIPAKLGADVYSRLFKAAVEGGKAVNEHALFGGPSSPAFNGDAYGTFENYVRLFIDKCHEQIDFLTEHHYGGNPWSFAASYEVATAYSDITHGKRFPVYNTEANNLGASSAGKAAYNTHDILAGILVNPDIYRGRALHALWSGKVNDEGELHAYTLLATLRGQMVVASSSDDAVLLVASSPQPGRYVVVAWNSGWSSRPVTLSDSVPGLTVTEAVMLLSEAPRNENKLQDPEGQPIPAPPAGKTSLVTLAAEGSRQMELPPRSAMRWTLESAGGEQQVLLLRQQRAEQSFVDVVFKGVKPGEPVAGKVVWRGDLKPAEAHAAQLRVITADVHEGEAIVEINGHRLTLPYTDAHPSGAEVQTLELDPAWLSDDTTVTFRVADPSTQNGFRILAASIMLTKTEARPQP